MEIIDADGASDEQLAGRMMRTSATLPSLFPKCLAVVCDRTHAARRLTSRPWAAYAFIKGVLDEIIWKRFGLLYMIEHSDTVSGIFNRFCAEVEGTGICATRIKNLRKKKARFDSCTKPMGRMILWFDALIFASA